MWGSPTGSMTLRQHRQHAFGIKLSATETVAWETDRQIARQTDRLTETKNSVSVWTLTVPVPSLDEGGGRRLWSLLSHMQTKLQLTILWWWELTNECAQPSQSLSSLLGLYICLPACLCLPPSLALCMSVSPIDVKNAFCVTYYFL